MFLMFLVKRGKNTKNLVNIQKLEYVIQHILRKATGIEEGNILRKLGGVCVKNSCVFISDLVFGCFRNVLNIR